MFVPIIASLIVSLYRWKQKVSPNQRSNKTKLQQSAHTRTFKNKYIRAYTTLVWKCPQYLFPERQQQEARARHILQGRCGVHKWRLIGRRRAGVSLLPRPHRRHVPLEGGERVHGRGWERHQPSCRPERGRRLWSIGEPTVVINRSNPSDLPKFHQRCAKCLEIFWGGEA